MNQIGFVTVYVDKLTPCLRDNSTGILVDTEVIKINKKSFLKNFNSKNGWYVNWNKLSSENEIYALRIKGTEEIQGIVALYNDREANAVGISWMCAAPHNNIAKYGKQKYAGVGGHLFAVAIRKSKELGYDEGIYGVASDNKLLNHYVNDLGAECIGIIRPNHFIIVDEAADNIEEVYDYEWTDEEI